MRKAAFYNEPVGAKADSTRHYSIQDNQGLEPGVVPLPTSSWESSTAARVRQKKKRKVQMMAKKASLLRGFSEELQKLGFNGARMGGGAGGMMGGGMGGGMTGRMAKGGVVSSKSKKRFGPHIRIVTSKSQKRY